jgi:mRNA interferase MazF
VGRFVRGEVVVIPFPFSGDVVSSDAASKRRPALVLAALAGDDLILCMITSESTHDAYAIALRDQDFARGTLHPKRVRTPSPTSYIRPNRLLTAEEGTVLRSAGQISDPVLTHVVQRVTDFISGKRV